VEAGEVAVRCLVVSGGDPSPGLELVDQALDGVPILVEIGVVADRPTARGALLLPVGGLVPLLRDHCLDTAPAQVGPVAAGGVGLVPGDRVRPGAGAADGAADPYLPQHGDELWAVGNLACGQHERQRAALAVGGQVNLAGLPAPGASQEGGLQPEFSPAPDASSLLPLGIDLDLLSVLFFETAPFDLAFSASAAAFSSAPRTSSPRCIPAASW
jgi:hypothetical protein